MKTGTIYQGRLKSVCIPVLNCHSCPLAFFSCPVGALQYFFASGRLSTYLLGGLGGFTITFGRMGCGLLCPFGLLQDILFRLGTIRTTIPAGLTWLKYIVLGLLVVLLPALLESPTFCMICPAGLLEAGFPLALLDSSVAERLINPEIGLFLAPLFAVKTVFLTLLLTASTTYKRPFCRVLCPLGALFGLFNKVSLIKIEVDQAQCNHCGRCARICPVDLDISSNPDSAECVRCFKCTYLPCINVNLRTMPSPKSQTPSI